MDLQAKNTALKASWPIHWKNREEEVRWIFESFPIKNPSIWECNIAVQDIDKMLKGTNSVMTSIWKAWAMVSYKDSCENVEEILESVIWDNSLIRVKGLPIFEPKIVNSNIDRILDIYDPTNRRLFTYKQLTDTFGPNIEFLQYCSIRAAIPNLWKIIIRTEGMRDVIELGSRVDKLDKKKNTTKNIYWTIIEKRFPVRQGARITWEKDLEMTILEDEWWNLYPFFLQNVKPAKLRYFQYRILTRSLTLNVMRNKWDSTISKMCTFCQQEIETITHIMYNCRHTENLWGKLSKVVQYFLKVDLQFDIKLIVLNNYKGPSKELINMFIVMLKQYIYAKKCFNEIPTFVEFMQKIATWYQIDLCNAALSGKTDKCKKKWKKSQNIFY